MCATLALSLVGCMARAAEQCPPPGFDSMSPFNLSAWVEHPWYIQEQMPVSYLRENRFYCVRAMYERIGEKEVKVLNEARDGSVTGEIRGREFGLKAVIPDLDDPSKLKVGPTFLPSFLYGPYWILYAGPDEDNYEYGIVSGGPPKNQGEDGCIAGSPSDVNGAGLWLFTKEALPDQELVDDLRQKAKDLGFDTSVLGVVQQEGCTYPDE